MSTNFKSLILTLSGLILAALIVYHGLTVPPTLIPKNEQKVLSAVVTPSPTLLVPGFDNAQVLRVVDGDTIEVSLHSQTEKVRYLGINTPETVDPRKKVECFGHEASNQNKQLLEGKTVLLEKDIEDRDKYNRLLRYVYLPTGGDKLLFVNDYLVREGFAQLDTFPPNVKYVERLTQAQTEARENNRGLWNKCKG